MFPQGSLLWVFSEQLLAPSRQRDEIMRENSGCNSSLLLQFFLFYSILFRSIVQLRSYTATELCAVPKPWLQDLLQWAVEITPWCKSLRTDREKGQNPAPPRNLSLLQQSTSHFAFVLNKPSPKDRYNVVTGDSKTRQSGRRWWLTLMGQWPTQREI